MPQHSVGLIPTAAFLISEYEDGGKLSQVRLAYYWESDGSLVGQVKVPRDTTECEVENYLQHSVSC